jgi:hypothetical protein
MTYPRHPAPSWRQGLAPATHSYDAQPVDRLRPFQDAETSAKGRSGVDSQSIEFHLDTVMALIAPPCPN